MFFFLSRSHLPSLNLIMSFLCLFMPITHISLSSLAAGALIDWLWEKIYDQEVNNNCMCTTVSSCEPVNERMICSRPFKTKKLSDY